MSSSSSPIPITKPLKSLASSSTSPSDSDPTQEFDEKVSVYESYVKLSPPQGSSSSPPSSPLSDYVFLETSSEIAESLEKGIDDDDNEKKQLSGVKCFPAPPISCLRKVKVGKPCKYLTYDKESESYVVEEIKIPNGSLFHASREDGRLKLYMNFSDEE